MLTAAPAFDGLPPNSFHQPAAGQRAKVYAAKHQQIVSAPGHPPRSWGLVRTVPTWMSRR